MELGSYKHKTTVYLGEGQLLFKRNIDMIMRFAIHVHVVCLGLC